ncbi:MAG: alpha-E domain-containing protein [Granulosicoccus sp.]|nr:alpha-E domain-containing protein [Granulosicoccus sp.]
MLSRVAENVYWLSRYLERIENTARMINVHGRSLMDTHGSGSDEGWLSLIAISGMTDLFFENFEQANEANITEFLICDTRNPGSIINGTYAIKNNLRSSRDIFPKQLYERISTLIRYAKRETENGISIVDRRLFLDTIERLVLEISGAVHGSLRHDQAYKFMRMACYLERADMTTRVLDVPSTTTPSGDQPETLVPFENRDWTAVLRSISAVQMYRRHVRRPVDAEGCLNFLLNDSQLPGACRFCFEHLDRCLEHFKHNSRARASVQQLIGQLNSADIPALAKDASVRHQYLDQLQLGLLVTGNIISETYFPPATESL